MPNLNITSNDIYLIKQQVQRRYTKIVILNRVWNTLGTIKGTVTSGNINIDANSNIRRTASLSMVVDPVSVYAVSSITMDTYIQIKCGIENNLTTEVTWYNMGYYIINQSGFKYDPKSRTLDLSLSDLMTDLTGDRAGTLHAYTSLVKNEQNIDDVMVNVLKLAGYDKYDIQAFSVQSAESLYYDTDNDFEANKIPYNIDFSAGVTAYEILDKLVSLYPYYTMYFDVNGTFVCGRTETEDNTALVALDANTMRGLIQSEEVSIDWNQVKNKIEVWGKDGLYYGEAEDDNPESPFNVQAMQTLRYVVTGSEEGIDVTNICDRYRDTEKATELLKEQAKYEGEIARLSALENPTAEEEQELVVAKANLRQVKNEQLQNIAVKGDDLAKQWAKYLLWKKARLNDTVTLQTLMLPFVTDVGFKLSYDSRLDDLTKNYYITGASHDLASNTTTLTGVRFYNDEVSAYWDQLPSPVVTAYSIDEMTLTVSVDEVPNATSYTLVIDGKRVVTSTGTTLVYTLPEEWEGDHVFYVRASADGWRDGVSEDYTVNLSLDTLFVTDNGDELITNSNDNLIINEEVD